MIYILLATVAAVMIAAAVIGCRKPGADDGICKYDREEDREK